MCYVNAFFLGFTLVGAAIVTAQEKKPPEKLVFQSKSGNVIFTHSIHINRAKGECAMCHDKLWPRPVKEPLKSSDGCRTCHYLGGRAFEMKGNCVKCHSSSGAKTKAK